MNLSICDVTSTYGNICIDLVFFGIFLRNVETTISIWRISVVRAYKRQWWVVTRCIHGKSLLPGIHESICFPDPILSHVKWWRYKGRKSPCYIIYILFIDRSQGRLWELRLLKSFIFFHFVVVVMLEIMRAYGIPVIPVHDVDVLPMQHIVTDVLLIFSHSFLIFCEVD